VVLKKVDSKWDLIGMLKTLSTHPKLYPSKREEVKRSIENLVKGWRNEREASYYIDTYYKDSEDVIVLHDLRLVTPTESVQIDHLLLFKSKIVILESKYFSTTLHYDRKNREFYLKGKKGTPIPIPDPVKQAERQKVKLERILKGKGLDRLFPPAIDYYVIVSPKVKFSGKMPERVLKGDQFRDRWEGEGKSLSFFEALGKFFTEVEVSPGQLKKGGERLVSLHRPHRLEFYLQRLNLL
jgi:hypothetical protein